MGRRLSTVAVLLLACVRLSGTGHAQGVTGTLFGAITDESNAVLPGVTATITSTALPGGPAAMVTDQTGHYRFAGLAPGVYKLTITLPGFTVYIEELRVTAGGTVERNITLKVATVAETITVSGQSPMVDTRNVAVTNTTTKEAIESLPTIRVLVTDYLQAVPGVAAANPGVYNEQVRVMGSPSNATTYVHDGIVINNPYHGNSWSASDIDAVEEIQTVVLGASAEYAVAAGGVVNVVTKAGTNNLRGDAASYWKPDSLQSEPLKIDCRCPLGQTGFNLGKMRDWSAHVGGPIVRDRLWFYGGYRSHGFTFSHPGTYLPEATIGYWNMVPTKVTAQITERSRVMSKLHMEFYGGYGGATPTRSVAFEATTTGPAHIHSYGEELNQTFGDSAVLTVRVGGWWEPGYFVTPRTGNLDRPNRFDNLTGYSSQGGPLIYRNRLRRDAQSVRFERYVSGDAVTHNFRLGAQLERGTFRREESYPSGVRYFDYGGAPDYALFRDPSVQASAFNTQGAWADDQVTIGKRLTLSLGLRFDRLEGTSPDMPAVNARLEQTGGSLEGLGSLFTWNVIAPRLGANLRLTEDGRTVLRGTYGRAYRQVILNEFDIVHPGIQPVTQARFDPATGGYTQIVSVTNSRSNIAVDPDVKAPFTDTFSLGLDRQLMRQVAVSASYVHKRGENLIGWRDIGGVYGTRTEILPDGRSLTVYPLLNSPSARLFQRTTRSDYADTYHGIVMSLAKRLSQRWQGQVGLTLSRSEGLAPPAGTFGQDPNDLINAVGRLGETDRPIMFIGSGSYDIPRIEVQLSANYQNMSHLPFAPQAFVQLPQGRRAINIDEPGSYRPERVSLLFFRVNKIFQLGHRRLEVMANILNALQSQAAGTTFATFNYFSPLYAAPAQWVQPRQMYVGARVNF